MNRARAAEQKVRREIRAWMVAHRGLFIDRGTGEFNCTAAVEAWDAECAGGDATLDNPDHVAWEVAVDVADLEERGALQG